MTEGTYSVGSGAGVMVEVLSVVVGAVVVLYWKPSQ